MRAWTKLQKATVAATLVYAVVFVCMLTIRPGSRQFYYAFFNTYEIFPPLLAGIAGLIFYRKGQHNNPVRRVGWLLIALGCLSFSVGQCTWAYFESIKGIQAPFPSLADAGYLGNYFLLIAGGLLLFGSMPIAGRARRLLDCAIAASSMGILSWSFIVQRLWSQSDVSTIGKCISIAYPLGDVAGLFGAALLLSNARHNRAMRRSLYFLAFGILGFTFFDTSFTWMSLNGTYRTGSWSDWTASFGWILIGYSFLSGMWWVSKEQPDTDSPECSPCISIGGMRGLIAPYVAVAAACLIVGVQDYVQDGNLQASSVAAGVFLMVLVIIRQVLALMENRSLNFELKAFNDNLEKIVAQRTKALEVQNERILAVVEERNRFFRNVSHELRTPLTSVIGFTELLMDDTDEPLTQWQKSQLQRVVDNAGRLLSMVNDLLDISKVEAGKMELRCNAIELDALIEQVVGSMMPLASEKALEFRVNVPDDLPTVTSDEQKLSQILVNLLSNAIKFTPEGSITISAAKNSQTVSISVEDTGVGIAEDKLGEVFKEFYRVQDGASRERGTGLGLSIAQKFAGILGGRISVVSKQGVGSTFTLTLPIEPKTRRKVDSAAG